MSSWIREALVHGGALCVFMGVTIAASLWHNPKIWVHSAPPAVREQVGPIDEQTKRQKNAWGVVMLVGLVAILSHLIARVNAAANDGYSFEWVFLAVFVCFEVFNLFDALVIDVSLVVFEPKWAMIPGIDTTALRDPKWHFQAFLKGLIMGAPFAAMVTGIGWIVCRLLAF